MVLKRVSGRFARLVWGGHIRGALFGGDNLPARVVFGVCLDHGGELRVGRGLSARGRASLTVRSGGSLRVGEDVYLGDGFVLVCRSSIVIESGVMFGPRVCVFDHDHDYRSSDRKSSFVQSPVYIGSGAWIGAGAVILKGSRIGSGAVIGANTVVRGDVPPGAVAVGSPCRVVGEC